MSSEKDSKPFDDLVFYVDEEGDDFTFYLDRDEEDTVITELANKKLKAFLTSDSKERGREMCSFSERILIKNLFLTKDSVRASEDFWTRLGTPAQDSAYGYLLRKLQETNNTTPHVTGLLQGNLDKPQRKELLEHIVSILNDAIRQERLETMTWVKNTLPAKEEAFISALDGDRAKQWRNRLLLDQTLPETIKQTQAGRGLICFSYIGKYLSVTFRKIGDGRGYKADPYTEKQQAKRKDYLFSLAEYCDLVYREVFKRTGSTQHAQGLLVITGSTKSGKSEIARGLIDLYLTNKANTKRRLHLVTFEDPVERFYTDEEARGCNPWHAVELSSKSDRRDYTPRQKEKDARSLEEALADALRQTPALFFVGETRNKEEWKVLLDFAATGHLIVTTAHAGSLVEAMHKIFEALEVETAADRSEIASKLLGVIHLRSDDLEFKETLNGTKRTNALFPALWRRTPRGIAALTSDGLASLLPYRPKCVGGDDDQNETNEDGAGNSPANPSGDIGDSKLPFNPIIDNGAANDASSCLGRRWFIQRLIEDKETIQHLESVFPNDLEQIRTQAYRKATEWDLQGV